ncbi:D-alanyl-D-alanine carboxypeptidase family protein [Patescibacteria group bacterium]|nr:D-alanyl-D-alanine carboxypeptidase family protein [Patescibacteria group bacterium]MBU1754730.1 D-alanyl-D-alanine carboxypeptidase family protein [Patescibacteria group bacterium]
MGPFLRYLPWILAALLTLGIGSIGYVYLETAKDKTELAVATVSLQTDVDMLQEQLDASKEEAAALSKALEHERDRNDDLNDQVDDISSTVGTLQKLAETDPELLQKYSKIYFLNENYVPPKLAEIDSEYVLPAGTEEQVHAEVWPYLRRLLRAADKDGLDLNVISGFRSFEQQASLKAGYKVVYGTGANAFSADQGYSEHQLGTTVDFTTEKIGSTFTGFEQSEEFAWLQKNAYRYGFILSYPANNSYYQYEPWHWRFVGTELADMLHDKGIYFYSLDQRTIDTYLINLFD